jgi:DNA-binding IclR family transcriptional regulator
MTSLQKIIDILELFLGDDEELSISELSRLSGIHKSTINRIATYLVKRDYLKQFEKRGKYSLGMKFLDYSALIKKRVKIREIALHHLTQLRNLIAESCMLIVWDGKKATLLDTIHCASILRATPDENTVVPLHVTSAGKIFLANMSNEELDEYLFSREIKKKYTEYSVTSPAKLKKEIKTIKKDNIAYDVEELNIGLSSVAAGIRDINENIVGVVAVIGPIARLPLKKLREIAPKVKKCADDISSDLGSRDH